MHNPLKTRRTRRLERPAGPPQAQTAKLPGGGELVVLPGGPGGWSPGPWDTPMSRDEQIAAGQLALTTLVPPRGPHAQPDSDE